MTVILPEVNFLTTNPEILLNDFVSVFEDLEGRKLADADPLKLIFSACASVITKQNIKINDAARQNLLYYARDAVLDHRGAECDTPRLTASPATVLMRLTLSEPLKSSRVINSGTMVTSNEATIFFATTKDFVIPVDVIYIDVEFVCTVLGTQGNGFLLGQINTLVNPLPYISNVENITTSNGGADIEGDDPFRERIYMAPESLTNAGSEGAYEYFAKSASSLISDVYVYMPTPGHVNISVLLQNGELPTQEIIDAVYEKCSPKTVRPLTDFLNVSAPEIINYDVELTYYIDTNVVNVIAVQEKIMAAIDEYIVWQSSKIGRDINPSKLYASCQEAGAKRIEVTSPSFLRIDKNQVAKLNVKNIVFGGVEDD